MLRTAVINGVGEKPLLLLSLDVIPLLTGKRKPKQAFAITMMEIK